MHRTWRIPRLGTEIIVAALVAGSVVFLLRSPVQDRNEAGGSASSIGQATPTVAPDFSAEDAVTYLQQKKSLTRTQAIEFLAAAQAKGDPSVHRIVDLDEFLARETTRSASATKSAATPPGNASP